MLAITIFLGRIYQTTYRLSFNHLVEERTLSAEDLHMYEPPQSIQLEDQAIIFSGQKPQTCSAVFTSATEALPMRSTYSAGPNFLPLRSSVVTFVKSKLLPAFSSMNSQRRLSFGKSGSLVLLSVVCVTSRSGLCADSRDCGTRLWDEQFVAVVARWRPHMWFSES